MAPARPSSDNAATPGNVGAGPSLSASRDPLTRILSPRHAKAIAFAESTSGIEHPGSNPSGVCMRIPSGMKAHSAPICYATTTGLFGCTARKRPNTIPIASKLIPPATMIGVVEMRSTHKLAIATPTA